MNTFEFDPDLLIDGFAGLTGLTYDDVIIMGMDEVTVVTCSH